MGNFTRDTFDRYKHYVGVRLQQGVPLVDADWNEQDDIRRHELRAFLKWFVGNGVPRGNDGFRIATRNLADDFEIAAGRILVEGWDAINDWDQGGSGTGRYYRSQRLYANAALAQAWGVAVLPALTAPSGPRTDRVYLDVWEREVNSAEDPALVNQAIGMETAVRTRREWVVRVAEGTNLLPSPPSGHVFYELATLSRPLGGGAITAAQITDRRRTGVTVVSQLDLQQLTTDAFGQGYALGGDGEPRLRISLREAINALLRNQLPGTPASRVSQNLSHDTQPYALLDRAGNIWAAYRAVRNNTWDLRVNRWNPATGAWSEAWLNTTADWKLPNLALAEGADGSIWLFYSRYGDLNLWAMRNDPGTGSWGPETLLTPGERGVYPAAVTDAAGDVWAFFVNNTTSNIRYMRWARSTSTWGPLSALTASGAGDDQVSAVVDRGGNLWVFWTRNLSGNRDVFCNRMVRSTGQWVGETRLTSVAGYDVQPRPLVDAAGDVWVFYSSDRASALKYDVYYQRYSQAAGTWGSETLLTSVAGDNWGSSVLLGTDGDLWVIQTVRTPSNLGEVWGTRYSPGQGWGVGMLLSSEVTNSWHPTGMLDAAGNLQLVWYSYLNDGSLWTRRLVTTV